MAAKKQCDGTECPAGCCPEKDWFCCDDNMHCAATEADCPFVANKLVKMAAKKQCDGTECPAGCCPEKDWFCCESGFEVVPDSDDTLYEVRKSIDGDDFTVFSISVMPLNDLGINLLALFGLLAMLRLGVKTCCEQNKYDTIESAKEQ